MNPEQDAEAAADREAVRQEQERVREMVERERARRSERDRIYEAVQEGRLSPEDGDARLFDRGSGRFKLDGPPMSKKSKRKSVETWTDADTLPVPIRVLRLAEPLAIDLEIKERFAGRAPRVREEVKPIAIWFGRRALATAIRAVDMELTQNRPRDEWEYQWLDIRDGARQAAEALDGMLLALHPPVPRPSSQKLRAARPRWYAENLRRTRLGAMNAKDTGEMRKRARRDVDVLLTAKSVAKRLARDAERRRKAFTTALQNPGEPEKRVFVKYLAEAWTFLMGRRPGTGSSKNPFLNFAEAAWTDWKGENVQQPSFEFALRGAVEEISDAVVDEIVKEGPSWERAMNPSPNLI